MAERVQVLTVLDSLRHAETQMTRAEHTTNHLADFLRGEITRRYGKIVAFAKAADFPRSSLNEILKGKSTTASRLRHLEGALDLPRGILDYIAEGKPRDMGTQWDRDLWDIYLLSLSDEQRTRAVELLQEKYAAGEYRETGT